MRSAPLVSAVVLILSFYGCGGGSKTGGGSYVPHDIPGPTPGQTGGGGGGGGGGADYSISASITKLNVPPGGSVGDVVTVHRSGGFDGTVTLAVLGLPADVTADAPAISGSSATVTFHADATAAHPSAISVVLQGSSSPGTRTIGIDLTARGVPGALDASFGGTGWVDLANPPAHLERDSKGRVLIAGTAAGTNGNAVFTLTRVTSAGALDGSFGSGGRRMIPVGTDGGASSEVVLPDDSILVVGSEFDGMSENLALVHVRSDGSLDMDFGGTGRGGVFFDIANGMERGSDVALLPDGKIAVTGEHDGDVLVARFLPDGLPDTAFAGTGYALIDLGGTDAGHDLGSDGSGRIVVACTSDGTGVAIRLTPAGALDGAFGGTGKVELTRFMGGRSLFVFGDGGAVFGGDDPLSGAMAAMRLTAAGAPDPSFGTGGYATVGKGDVSDIEVDHGSVLLAGVHAAGFSQNFAISRLTSAGAADPGFGTDGMQEYDVGTGRIEDMDVLPDGRAIAVGHAGGANPLIRIWL